VSDRARRFFWGHTLTQALAAAARWYGVEPAELGYRVREKRHGFIKVRRPVVIEVDPEAPRRPAGANPRAQAEAAEEQRAPARARAREDGPVRAAAPRHDAGRADSPRPREARPSHPEPRRAPARRERALPAEAEAWHAPDEESAAAVAEAARRLLRLAGLDLTAQARITPERLEVELTGPDQGRLPGLGLPFLDHLEHLLPRAARQLSGKLVRVRLEGAGLRAERERELRAEARAGAERVLASGREELLGPLDPGERRIVHLELADRPGILTESVGTGLMKRLRIAPAPAGSGQDRP
jgi:spoIIIJ-associated protein